MPLMKAGIFTAGIFLTLVGLFSFITMAIQEKSSVKSLLLADLCFSIGVGLLYYLHF